MFRSIVCHQSKIQKSNVKKVQLHEKITLVEFSLYKLARQLYVVYMHMIQKSDVKKVQLHEKITLVEFSLYKLARQLYVVYMHMGVAQCMPEHITFDRVC
jgi:hypothetical protein